MTRSSNILHEAGKYWVGREHNAKRRRWDFYVYRIEGTHSVRCGTFALNNEAYSLRRAIADCNRRAAL